MCIKYCSRALRSQFRRSLLISSIALLSAMSFMSQAGPAEVAADSATVRQTIAGLDVSPELLDEVADIASAQYGAIRHVANNGVDTGAGAGCGARAHPCRSISKAIELANEGDLILVGPGRYGDLNRDFSFQPGDEAGGVFVNKRLTIASIAGAQSTIIEAYAGGPGNVVITADGAVFGLPGRGFTLTGGALGVSIEARNGVVVMDNIARGGQRGFLAFLGSNHRLVRNLAIDNSEAGFQIRGLGVRVIENVAVSNNVGISLENIESWVSRNVAIGNETGFDIFGLRHILQRNAAIGNRGYGMRLFDEEGVRDIRIRQSNIYGNNTVARNGNLNCGIANESGQVINATNNFWGATSGPGSDPADRACDLEGGRLLVTPFGTAAFEVLPP